MTILRCATEPGNDPADKKTAWFDKFRNARGLINQALPTIS
jgi:hypothetical protein